MRVPRNQAPWWPAVVSLGPALVVPLALGPDLLARGGLAPVAVAGLVAAFAGVPAALAEWRSDEARDPAVRAGWSSLVELLLVGSVAAALAPFVGELGWKGVLVAVGLWGAPTLAVLRGAPLVAAALAPLAVLLAAGGAASAWSATPGWTLLDPRWDAWRGWLPPALVLGLLLGSAGVGQWTLGPRRRPGERRAPWAPLGLALLLATALAARSGARFEAFLGHPPADPLALGAVLLAGMAAVGSLQARSGLPLRSRLAVGLLATLWFAGPAAGALPFWWGAALPLGLLLALLTLAPRADVAGRWSTLAAAGLAGVGLLVGWPGVPAASADAAAAALTLVLVFWVVATRAVLVRRLA